MKCGTVSKACAVAGASRLARALPTGRWEASGNGRLVQAPWKLVLQPPHPGGGRQNLQGLIRALSFQGRRRTIIRCRWQAAANGALARTGRRVLMGVCKIVSWPVYEARQDCVASNLALPGQFFFFPSNITFGPVACGSCLGQRLNQGTATVLIKNIEGGAPSPSRVTHPCCCFHICVTFVVAGGGEPALLGVLAVPCTLYILVRLLLQRPVLRPCFVQ